MLTLVCIMLGWHWPISHHLHFLTDISTDFTSSAYFSTDIYAGLITKTSNYY